MARIAPMSRQRTKCIVGIAGKEANSPGLVEPGKVGNAWHAG
jgi:hypothetical protein